MFGKRKKKEHLDDGEFVMSMVLVLMQKKGAIRELLFMCMPFFDATAISIISVCDRSIVATTDKSEQFGEVENTAKHILHPEKEDYYLREEKNGLYFRKGVGCIRIFPLMGVNGMDFFFMVEQRNSMDESFERMFDVLSIALRMDIQEKLYNQNLRKDTTTPANNRIAFIQDVQNWVRAGKKGYIGMFRVRKLESARVKYGNQYVHAMLEHVVNRLIKCFEESVYHVSLDKYCVITEGDLFEVLNRMQDFLTAMAEEYGGLFIGCVMAPLSEKVYETMYLCEKLCDEEETDHVIVVNKSQLDFDFSKEEKNYIALK